jgi:1-acyl-sn-glycerol-3-phosphate acyltransferase
VIHTLIMLLFWAVTVPLAGLLAIPWTLISGNPNFLYRFGCALLRGGMRAAGIRVRTEGRERLDPTKPYIFMSNHVSNLDPPVLLPALPGRASVLTKKALFRIPILGYAMKQVGMVPIDRANRESAFASLHAAAEALRSGLHLMVFAEGTRSPDGCLQPLKKGPFHVAQESGVPVVPVTILGTYEAQPKGRFAIHPREATVVFHQPIDPAQYRERAALMAAVSESIESALPKERRATMVSRKA